MPKERLYNALLAAFNLEDAANPDNVRNAGAATEIFAAFAALLVPPVPAIEDIELVADDTPALILAELRKFDEHFTKFMWYVENGLVTRCR